MMFPDAVDRARHEMCHAVIEILQGGTVDRITLSQCAVFPRCCPAGDLLRFFIAGLCAPLLFGGHDWPSFRVLCDEAIWAVWDNELIKDHDLHRFFDLLLRCRPHLGYDDLVSEAERYLSECHQILREPCTFAWISRGAEELVANESLSGQEVCSLMLA
jgi:hypothetical protein